MYITKSEIQSTKKSIKIKIKILIHMIINHWYCKPLEMNPRTASWELLVNTKYYCDTACGMTCVEI